MDRLDSLALFVAVADLGGFGAAARKLGRSPAAVSRAIAALEDALGQRLFNRTTRALALTEAGEKLLQRGRRLLADYDDLTAEFQGAAELQGPLTITAPVMFGRLHIMPIVTQFLRDHPKIDVNLVLHDRVIGLIDEGVDLGLRIGDLPDSSLIALRVGAVRRVLVAAPTYLAAEGEPQEPDDLSKHALISTFGLSTSPTNWTFGAREDHALRLRPRLTVNSVDAALDAAVSGLGIARLYSYQVEQALARSQLMCVLRADEPPAVPIHLVRPAGRYPPKKLAAFIELATRVLRAKFGGANDAPKAS